MSDQESSNVAADAAWEGVSAAFAALGRAFLCADSSFRVLHASIVLDDVLSPGASAAAAGRTLEDMFGAELFGPSGVLRLALVAGERREGWRAHLRLDDSEHRLVSVSAAPFPRARFTSCNPDVAYVVAVRPAEEDPALAHHLGPTTMSGVIARSQSMRRIFHLIENLRHSEATVLITGESGTGKEIVARAIHEHSPRKNGPFVAVNCGALPADLLESEMFGHVRGSFTGAVRDRMGRFELASSGTLFLDEVGDLPLPLQVKLLRVLQDGTFERVGEERTRTSKARVISATHVDLGRAVREGRFRDDLYYRLRVLPIEIAPLRQRREDIEPLALGLLARVGARQSRALRLSPEALKVLLDYDWPGNVRELENVLEYAVAVCQGQTILPENLPELVPAAPPAREAAAPPPEASPTLTPVVRKPNPLATIDRDALQRTLQAHRWRRADAAKALGVSRSTLWRWIREAGLE